jgi:predicted SnoaL-like aldol condensation-catalyzing enzyme
VAIEQNKIIVTRLFEEMWLKGNLAVADELVASDYMLHNGMLPPGREGLKQSVVMMRESFPAFGAASRI